MQTSAQNGEHNGIPCMRQGSVLFVDIGSAQCHFAQNRLAQMIQGQRLRSLLT